MRLRSAANTLAHGRLVAVSLDCADPCRLADFYLGLLGAVLVSQRVDGYVPPPVWPGSSVVRLDLTASGIDAAARRAIVLGAIDRLATRLASPRSYRRCGPFEDVSAAASHTFALKPERMRRAPRRGVGVSGPGGSGCW